MLTITAFYAGVLALWFLVLSLRVVQLRSAGVSYGDGGDPVLHRRIRAHGNFAEYVPLLLLLLALLEVDDSSPEWALHLIGLTLVAARLLHGVSLSFRDGWAFGRRWGAALTFLLLLLTGLLCAWRGLVAVLN